MKLRRAPSDPALPGLAELASVEGLPAVVAEAAERLCPDGPLDSARLDYVRYRPGLRCTFLWSLPNDSGPLSATLLSEEGEALWAGHRGFQQVAGGASKSVFVTQQRLLVQAFPDDIGLPGLSSATSREWALEVLGSSGDVEVSITPWRYRPQLACVLEYVLDGAGTASRSFAKVYGDERHRTVWSALQQLQGRDPGWRSAAPMAYDAEAGVIVSEAIEGRGLAGMIEAAADDGDVKPGLLSHVVRIAELLPALQATAVDGLPELRAADTLAALRERARRVAHVAEQGELLVALCDELEERLADMDAEPVATAHGAFRDSQVLLTDDGPAVLDLDGLCRAGANLDGGTFLAGLDRILVCRPRLTAVAEACIAAFEDGVRKQPGYAPEWLAWHRAVGIAKKALQAISSLEARWPERVPALSERARATLAAAPAHSKVG